MFKNDIEMLNSLLDEIVREHATLENKLSTNNRNVRVVNELIELESDVESDKQDFLSTSLVSGSAVLASIILVILLVPSSIAIVLPIVMACTSLVGGVIALDNLLSWLESKRKYKNLATDDNLELVDNLENIKEQSEELNQKCEYLEKKISSISELIGYLTDYEDMITYLELIKKSEIDKVNKMFDEYLNEDIDYSHVHFSNELPEDFHLKTLTNVLK